MAMRASLFSLGPCGRGLDEGGVAACMTIRRACGTIFYYIVRSWAVHAAERSVAAVVSQGRHARRMMTDGGCHQVRCVFVPEGSQGF